MRKTQFYKILFLIIFWVCATIFIVFYEATLLGFQSEYEGEYYSFPRILVAGILVTIIGASILGSLEVLFFGRLLRKKPLGIAISIKTIFYILFILFFVSIVRLYLASAELGKSMFGADILDQYLGFLFSGRVVMTIIFWGIVCSLSIFILHVSDKFGHGVLLNFILGKYHHPKEEKRIFMFMDLKSSTTIAENLGHERYSYFIQDCFRDLHPAIIESQGEIYQYVGDEAIITLPYETARQNNNCLNVFFAFEKELEKKSCNWQTLFPSMAGKKKS